jgi:hypothetical protein
MPVQTPFHQVEIIPHGTTVSETSVLNYPTTTKLAMERQLGWAKEGTLHILTTDQDMATASDAIDIYFQTTYDNINWIDMAHFAFANASTVTNRDNNETANIVYQLHGAMSNSAAIDVGDAALVESTGGSNDISPGVAFRLKFVFTQTCSITLGAWLLLKG